MKFLQFLLIGILGLLTTACNDELPEERPFDFTGSYIGIIECSGALDEVDEDFSFTVNLVDVTTREYLLTFEDEVTFKGRQSDNTLLIDRQVHNEGGAFDVVTLQGALSLQNNSTFIMEFLYEVDDEGNTSCESTLTKN